MKYWHKQKLSINEYINKYEHNFNKMSEQFKQPDWCRCLEAFDDYDGCGSLLHTPSRISKEYCRFCQYYQGVKQ